MNDELALEAKEVVRRFGPVVALDGLSFSVRRGELFGLVGPDGAGKTTAVRALSGLLLPDSGRCMVFGGPPTNPRARERLGLMPQQYSLYRDLSVAENLRFFARLNALPKGVAKERSQRLLHITRLSPFLDRRADALSGGMYKKLALCCALLHEPDVLLLDEPTNGVDPVSRRELWQLLYEFVERGMAILISTPYMDEAERCHRVGLLHQGRLLLLGSPAERLAEVDDDTVEVEGGERNVIERALRDAPQVEAMSPSGSRLRIVVRRGGLDALQALLLRLGATTTKVATTFEDLYLARLRQESRNVERVA